jgi:hypothetical protein
VSKSKECWLTGMIFMLTVTSASESVPHWVLILLVVVASIEFLRAGYYFLTR